MSYILYRNSVTVTCLRGSVLLLHSIKGAACPEPLDLGLVHRMVECELLHAAVSMLQLTLHVLIRNETMVPR